MKKMVVEIVAADGCELNAEGIKEHLADIFRMDAVDGVKIIGGQS